MKKKFLFISVCAAIIFISCKKEEDNTLSFNKGFYISCEGKFGGTNASVSFYNSENNTLTNDIYQLVNNAPLGDVLNQIVMAGKKILLVVNNSSKVQIADASSFISSGKINVSYPRFACSLNDQKAFISSGSFSGKVYAFNPVTASIIDSVNVGMGPEKLIISGDYLIVANSGGWDYDSTLSFIDLNTFDLAKTITVADGPTDVITDKNEDIWVYCKGKTVYDETFTNILAQTPAKVLKLDANNYSTLASFDSNNGFSSFGAIERLAVSLQKDTLFVLEGDGIYAVSIDNPSWPADPIIEGSFSGLAVNPANGDLICLKSNGYEAAGEMIIVRNNIQIFKANVGIAPNSVAFK